MPETLRCPVCHKPLTQAEYDQALGLWKDKQEHIKHLEQERQEFKRKAQALKQEAKATERRFRQKEAKLRQETRQAIAAEKKNTVERLRKRENALKDAFDRKLKSAIKRGVQEETAEERKELAKQGIELRKTKNKMTQLENSLRLSTKKYQQANEEISRLKEQIEKGITPQIEGLLEEHKLAAKLMELFPSDKIQHHGKAGDIIQIVVDQRREIGRIVYECKRVKHFNRNYIDQAKEARRVRSAEFAVLVTNVFPSKKQFYFVEKDVFVISPVCAEPIIHTLRESLIRMSLLKMTAEAKQKAVQRVYDYLSSSDYNGRVIDMANQLLDLGRELKSEIKSHNRVWRKRYDAYRGLFNDIGEIDYSLKQLANPNSNAHGKLLPAPSRSFVHIDELGA
ncbi:MAG: DUF2130 domain-containing protein [Candidatus Acidiferrales bacterium]